jgi:pimeloyl-ACP methyl ester carboxylesterase
MIKTRIFFKWFWVPVGLLFILLAYVGAQAYYHLVYQGVVENITFTSNDIQLAGVLVKPNTPGPHPGMVILHGSGVQPRNKWFYRIHTNAFVRQGFAVLSYDKRGSGDSEDELRKATFPDLINDGVAAVSFLRSQPDIIPDQIGLFGVSESGWFTPEIAATDGEVAFIINRVGPPLPLATTALFEVKMEALNSGISEADTEDVLQLITRIWQFYIDAAADESVANGPERAMINASIAEMQDRPGVKDFLGVLPEYNAEEYKVRASKYAYDPYPFLTQIDIPMLYILAGQDVNVPFEPSVALLEELRQELDKDITIQAYPEADHYLYKWDIFPLEGLYVSGYLDLIESWATAQIAKK